MGRRKDTEAPRTPTKAAKTEGGREAGARSHVCQKNGNREEQSPIFSFRVQRSETKNLPNTTVRDVGGFFTPFHCVLNEKEILHLARLKSIDLGDFPLDSLVIQAIADKKVLSRMIETNVFRTF